MPNWCENTLSIDGEEKILKEFKEKAKTIESEKTRETDLSLNQFIPMPEFEEEEWYEWAIDNWGCKWDITAYINHESKKELIYTFDSPWSPPLEAIKRISKLYPTLNFTIDYAEPGMCFGGIKTYKNGKEIESDEYDIESCWECGQHFKLGEGMLTETEGEEGEMFCYDCLKLKSKE